LALRNFVADGGGLIINGSYSYSGRTAALLNSVFGFNTTENYAGYLSFGGRRRRSVRRFRPTRRRCIRITETNALLTSSLPAGALSLYESGGETAIALRLTAAQDRVHGMGLVRRAPLVSGWRLGPDAWFGG